MKLTASMLKTASPVELDILARAQMMEGISGNPVNSAIKLFSRGSSGMLAGIENLAKSMSPTVNPLWWARKDTGLYRAARAAAASVSKNAADDILQNVMLGVNSDGETIEAAFHYTGKFVSKTPALLNDFKEGNVAPNDGRILKGLLRGVRQRALDVVKRKDYGNVSIEGQKDLDGDAINVENIDTGESMSNLQALEALMSASGTSSSGLILDLLNAATKPQEYAGYKLYLQALSKGASDDEAFAKAGIDKNNLYVQRNRASKVLERMVESQNPQVMKIMEGIDDLGFYKELNRGRPLMANKVEAKDKGKKLSEKVSDKPTKAETKGKGKIKGLDQFQKLLDKLSKMVENGDVKAEDVLGKLERMTKLSSDQKLTLAVLRTASKNPGIRSELVGVVRKASLEKNKLTEALLKEARNHRDALGVIENKLDGLNISYMSHGAPWQTLKQLTKGTPVTDDIGGVLGIIEETVSAWSLLDSKVQRLGLAMTRAIRSVDSFIGTD